MADPNKIPELWQDHGEFRDRFVRVLPPDVILIDAKGPHRKFIQKVSKDSWIHGTVPSRPRSEPARM